MKKTWELIENLGNAREAIDVFKGTTITFINRHVSHTDIETAKLEWRYPKHSLLLFNKRCDAARQWRQLLEPSNCVNAIILLAPEVVDQIQEEPWCSPLILPNLPPAVRRVWIYKTGSVDAITTMICMMNNTYLYASTNLSTLFYKETFTKTSI